MASADEADEEFTPAVDGVHGELMCILNLTALIGSQ